MAVLDFPSDTSQSPYELNGITYNWDGQKWVASAGGGGSGGDLTLQDVTDNGNTTTNGATFGDGSISLDANGRIGTTNNVVIEPPAGAPSNNFMRCSNNNVNKVKLNAEGSLALGGDLSNADWASNDPNIQLNADGSASFAGNAGIGTNTPAVIAGMSRYLTLSETGTNGAVGLEFQGNRTGNDQTVGRISFINNTQENARITVDSGSGAGTNSNMIFATGGTTERMRIASNGDVTIGGNAENGGEQGVKFYPVGGQHITRDAGEVVFNAFSTGNSTPTIQMKSNGNADFKGVVTFDGEYTRHNAYQFLEPTGNNAGAYYYGTNTTSTSAIRINPTSNSGDPDYNNNILLNFDGSGEFSAGIKLGDSTALLDDYEEGSWVPKLVGDATYTVQTGTYTKIGRLVNVSFQIIVDQLNSSVGGLMEGLPFVAIVNPTQNGQGYGNCFIHGAVSYPADNFGSLMVTTADNSSMFTFFGMTTSLEGIINPNLATSGSDIRGNITYLTT